MRARGRKPCTARRGGSPTPAGLRCSWPTLKTPAHSPGGPEVPLFFEAGGREGAGLPSSATGRAGRAMRVTPRGTSGHSLAASPPLVPANGCPREPGSVCTPLMMNAPPRPSTALVPKPLRPPSSSATCHILESPLWTLNFKTDSRKVEAYFICFLGSDPSKARSLGRSAVFSPSTE